MGRYFKAQPVELNRDFIYQPPLELMAKALLKKDDDIQQQADTMELIRSLPIDFIDYHKEGAANIKNEINSDMDNFAKEIQGKAALDGSLKAKLNAYKNKLQERYSTGDIYNIQETAKNYRAFEKKLEDNKDISSALKEKFKQEYWNKYTNENPEGAYKSVYTPGPLIDDPNFIGEFGKYFKEFEPDMTAKTRDILGDKWITLTDEQKKELVLKEGMKNFMAARPDLEEVLKQQGKSSVFKDRNIVFTDNGDIDYTKGFAFDLAKAADEYNYTQTLKDSVTHELDPSYMWGIEMEYKRQADAQAKAEAKALSPNINTEEIFEKTIAQEQATEEWLQDLGKGLKNPVTNKPYVFKSLDHAISMLEKAKDRKGISKDAKIKLEAKLNKAIENKQQLLAASRATWSPLYDKFSEKTVDKIITATQNDFNKNGMTYKYSLPGLQTMDGKGNIATATLKDKYQEFTPANMIGKRILTPDKKWVNISNVKLGESSVKPSFINGVINDKNINDNDARVILEFSYQEGDEIKTFKQPAYYNMKNNQGFSFNFDNN